MMDQVYFELSLVGSHLYDMSLIAQSQGQWTRELFTVCDCSVFTMMVITAISRAYEPCLKKHPN